MLVSPTRAGALHVGPQAPQASACKRLDGLPLRKSTETRASGVAVATRPGVLRSLSVMCSRSGEPGSGRGFAGGKGPVSRSRDLSVEGGMGNRGPGTENERYLGRPQDPDASCRLEEPMICRGLVASFVDVVSEINDTHRLTVCRRGPRPITPDFQLDG